MSETPARYHTYTIRFDEEHAERGLEVLWVNTTDPVANLNEDTYIVNGDQLAILDAEGVPYEIIGGESNVRK